MYSFREFKNFFFAVCGVLVIFASFTSATSLDISDRPPALREAIDKKYQNLVRGKITWTYSGAKQYQFFMNLDENAVIKKIVDSYPKQKIFNFMDVGAGDHTWAKARVKFLNKEFAGQAIQFNIFSLTGDNYKEEGYQERAGVNIVEQKEGQCSLYKLSAFPIENLIAKLAELGYLPMLEKQVDVSVAAYTLMHLVDPIGAFLQMYNLARPNQGLIFVQDFFVQGMNDNVLVEEFLAHTQLEFFKPFLNHAIVVRRSDEDKAKFPYAYQTEVYDDERPRAKLVKGEEAPKNPKNTLYRKDKGSELLRDWLPFTEK